MKILFLVFTSCIFIPAALQAADSAPEVTSKTQIEPIALFTAIDRQLVTVKFIPLGSDQARVIIRNDVDEPIALDLPQTFGAIHVLAQPAGLGGGGLLGGGLPGIGQAGAGLGGLGGGQPLGGGQGLGGGFGAGGGVGIGGAGGVGFGGAGFGGAGGGAGFGGAGGRGLFRIEVGQTRKWTVHTVCLEHGKPDPNPRWLYQLVPLNQLNSDPAVHQLCQQLGTGQITQSTAQAAAWHLANGLGWSQLSAMNRRESKYTGNEKYFSAHTLKVAAELADYCRKTTNSLAATTSAIASPAEAN